MASVNFKRRNTVSDLDNIPIEDGNFIVTKDGHTFVDFDDDRIGIGGTPDLEMSDSSENSVQNKVVKGYIDNKASDINTNIETINTNIETINTKIGDLKKEIYSTEEIFTGKYWIDGKPIYRKVIDLGTLGNRTSINVDGIYDTIVSFDGYIYINDGGKLSLSQFNSTSMYRVISYDKPGDNSLKVVINRANVSNWDNWRLKIIVEYTKATDEVVSNE